MLAVCVTLPIHTYFCIFIDFILISLLNQEGVEVLLDAFPWQYTVNMSFRMKWGGAEWELALSSVVIIGDNWFSCYSHFANIAWMQQKPTANRTRIDLIFLTPSTEASCWLLHNLKFIFPQSNGINFVPHFLQCSCTTKAYFHGQHEQEKTITPKFHQARLRHVAAVTQPPKLFARHGNSRLLIISHHYKTNI